MLHARLLSLATPTTSARCPCAIPIVAVLRSPLGGSEFDFQAVERKFHLQVALMCQDLAAEMAQQHALDLETTAVGCQLRIVHMKSQLRAFVVRAFADEQIGALRKRHQLLVPPRVARVDNRAARDPQFKRERNVSLHVGTTNCADPGMPHPDFLVRLNLDEMEPGPDYPNIEARVGELHHPPAPALKVAGTDEVDSAVRPAFVQVLEHQKGDAAVMVAVQMAD